MNLNSVHSSSFRDPSGHLFTKDGALYRSVAKRYKEHYDFAKESGLFDLLMSDGLLVPHKEVDGSIVPDAYKVIQPEFINFISYPYEWCFSQLKDAALLTLSIQKRALEKGVVLKDASAFNVQFKDGKPVFIDTLSFEKYEEGAPWIGYRQFCQHFLAPLSLMSYTNLNLGQLSRVFIDGVPLDVASSMLPFKTFFKLSIASHIHLHAKSQKKHSEDTKPPKVHMSKTKLIALMHSLESAVKGLSIKQQETEWGDYYDNTNYSSESFKHKEKIVAKFLGETKPKSVWDLGANTGIFSRVASERDIETISFDIDPIAVEKNYLEVREKGEKCILPLISDLTNPSAGIGWANEERESLEERGPVDTVLALALVHHLAISNNLPFKKIANYFSRLCKSLVIEFVPKSDSKVRRLLTTREDIFTEYDEKHFEESFGEYFKTQSKESVSGSDRTMYLMSKK